VRYLLSILVLAFFLSGCSTAYHSLTDRLSNSLVMSTQENARTDVTTQQPAQPTSEPKIPEVESLQASYQETSHMDRF